MKFKDYAIIWITKNVPEDDIYGSSIRKFIMELCILLINQQHSGASFGQTLYYFEKLIEDYQNRKPV